MRALIGFTVFLLLACSGRPQAVTTSTSPLPPGVRGTIPASGDDCQHRLISIVPINGHPSTQAALQEAKDRCGCDVLTDVTVDDAWGTVLLWSWHCVTVEGLGVPPHKTGERASDYDGVEETSNISN